VFVRRVKTTCETPSQEESIFQRAVFIAPERYGSGETNARLSAPLSPIYQCYRKRKLKVCDGTHDENVRFPGPSRHVAFLAGAGVETFEVTGDYTVQSLLTVWASNVYNEWKARREKPVFSRKSFLGNLDRIAVQIKVAKIKSCQRS
jgi:hypothetical protein